MGRDGMGEGGMSEEMAMSGGRNGMTRRWRTAEVKWRQLGVTLQYQKSSLPVAPCVRKLSLLIIASCSD